jgi:hypothetical protein
MVAKCSPGLPTVANLMCSLRALWHGVEPEEGEEQVRFNAFGSGTVGHDQARVDPFEGTLGDDD